MAQDSAENLRPIAKKRADSQETCLKRQEKRRFPTAEVRWLGRATNAAVDICGSEPTMGWWGQLCSQDKFAMLTGERDFRRIAVCMPLRLCEGA